MAHFENIGFSTGSSSSKYRLFTGFSIKNIGFYTGSSKLKIRFKTEEKIFDGFLGQNYSDKVDLNFTKSERAKRARKKITIS